MDFYCTNIHAPQRMNANDPLVRYSSYICIENAEGNVLYAYVRACYSHKSKSIKPNHMKFGGMISYYPGTI